MRSIFWNFSLIVSSRPNQSDWTTALVNLFAVIVLFPWRTARARHVVLASLASDRSYLCTDLQRKIRGAAMRIRRVGCVVLHYQSEKVVACRIKTGRISSASSASSHSLMMSSTTFSNLREYLFSNSRYSVFDLATFWHALAAARAW